MATHDYVIDNASGSDVRSDINSALQAIVSNNSSSSEPSPTFAYMRWQDTNNNLLKLRDSSNNAWITLRGSDGSFQDIVIASNAPFVQFNETNFSPFILVQSDGNFSLRQHDTPNNNYAFAILPNNTTTAATEYDFDFKQSRVTMSRGLKINGTFNDTQNSEIVISGVSPQILFENTTSGGHDFYIHVASNKFYILRDSDGSSGNWDDDQPYPMQLESDTNDAYIFGRRIIDDGEFSVNSGGSFSGTCTATEFSGGGAGLTSLNASNLAGTINADRIPSTLKTTTSLATNAELKIEVERSDADKGHALLGIRQVGTYSAGAVVPTGFIRLAEGNTDDQNIFVGTDNKLRIAGSASSIGGTGGSVVGDQSSDIRLKTLLDTPVPGLSKIKELNPIRFAYNNASGERLGFSAQDVQPILPESVYDTNDPIKGEADDAPTMLAMRYTEMIPVLVNAVKELSIQVEALTARVAALEA